MCFFLTVEAFDRCRHLSEEAFIIVISNRDNQYNLKSKDPNSNFSSSY